MKRFHQYLLTHYPLLWNTRVVWVLLANAVLHLLFFFGGLGSVTVKTLAGYYSVSRVGGETLYIFSILCALLVLIVWCLFYLRNNAFKSFYRLSKFYLAKEFALIFLIILTTISYAQSFEWGVKMRVRSITNEKELMYEMTEANKGMVYVPVTKVPYFLLNNCTERRLRNDTISQTYTTPYEGSPDYGGRDSVLMKKALAQPDAYSYANYCSKLLNYISYSTEGSETISNRNKSWLKAGHRDSVKQSIIQLFAVLNKYGVEYRLNAEELTAAVFKDSLFTLGELLPQQRFNYQYGEQENKYYFNDNQVTQLFNFIEGCQPNADNWREVKTVWNVIGHLALSLSILLLCYRRFSRKVFLISVVGTLVWMIIIGLITASSHETDGFPYLLLVLCTAFLLIALGLLGSQKNKTATGVLLNWHAYLIPFAVMLIVAIIHSYHSDQLYRQFGSSVDADVMMQRLYPFSTWVVAHETEIFLANILAVALYVAFVFNNLAKRWHLLPEE